MGQTKKKTGPLTDRIRSRVRRISVDAYKTAIQRVHPSAATSPVFLVGCQRSGTNMCVDVLDRSNEIYIYPEARTSPAYLEWRIRDTSTIQGLVDRCNARAVIFKPLLDSQYVDQWLERFSNGKVIWMYRHSADVSRSAVKKWGPHQKNVIADIAEKGLDCRRWQAERITPETVAVIRELYTPEMNDIEAGSLKWYIRNQLFFDLGLEGRPEVMLLKYEDMVVDPATWCARIFNFLGCEYDPRYLRGIFASSVGTARAEALSPNVAAVCDEMEARLDRACKQQFSPVESVPTGVGGRS